MRRILAQTRKELTQIVRDWRTLALALVLPLILLVLLSTALSLTVNELPIVVQDFDDSSASRNLIDAFRASLTLHVTAWPVDKTAEEALALGVTGPLLRSTGVAWDLRRAMPYLAYDQVDFDVIAGTVGDTFDRYAVRLNEIRESCRIVAQILEKLPPGDYRSQDKKVTPPPRARIDESMEALIHHFKIFTRGFEVPAGEVYTAVESPRGELGCYLVSDGTNKPYRLHVRAPSFVNLQSLPALLRGGLIADAIAVISSVDPVMGEVDR